MTELLTDFPPSTPGRQDRDVDADITRRRWDQVWVAVPALTVLVLGYRHRFMSDDGLIVTRSVREILAGNGPVLSPGLRVETSTSTAWQWLLAVAAWLTHIDAAALAVYGGLLLTTAGVALAVRGTQRLHRMEPSSSDAPLLLPAGVLILLGLRPVWDFATSGLETGLETFWIGTAWWILNAGEPTTRRRGLFFAFVLGAGPLVRPDLAVVAGIFLVVRWVRRTPPRRILAAQLGAAAVLPVGYEIFRMGYYGLLVPTTAVAKESGATFWERGRLYLLDFVVPFRLWLVLPVALALVALVVVRRRREGRDLTVVAAPVAAAAVATIFVVRVGGDWMQARMLLPPLLLLLLPVLVVPVERRHRLDRAIAVGAVAVAVWAALLGSGLLAAGAQNPIVGTELRRNIQSLTGRAHPLTGRDFANVPPDYPAAVDRYSGRPVLLVFSPLFGDDRLYPTPVRTGRAGPVFVAGYLGAAGAAVPLDDTLIDQLSLGYPVGAHLQLQRQFWAGHEKLVSNAWILGDYGEPGAPVPAATVPDVTPQRISAARHALSCGRLAELQASYRDPLTVRRFFANIRGAVGRTSLRIPRDPLLAERQFCPPP